MSYNTRRAAGNVQSPQVSYHQGPNTPQRGGAQQRPGGPNAAYASHFSSPVAYNQPGFNNMNKPPQADQQLKPAAAAPEPPLPAAPQQPQAAAAPQPPLPPPQTAAATDATKMETDDAGTNGAAATTTQAASGGRPAWMKKGAAVKVNKVQKRRRQNARLRKLLVPKNALMAINEICPGPKFIVQEHTNALNQTIYSVRLEIDGKIHSGQSINKTHAKQMACENALKDILVSRMQSQLQAGATGEFPTPKQEGDAIDKDEAMSNDGSTLGGSSKHPEDDMPWGCLASFALHKLFLEWQNQGVEIPITNAQPNLMRRNRAPSLTKSSSPAGVQPIKKIPEDANKKHPVLMLNHLQPGLQYSERTEGAPPSAVFVFTVTIDGQVFTGSGTTKKEAKKECAKAALVKYGIISEY